MGSCLQRANTVSQSESHHEVAIQRGTSLREEEGRGREDSEEIPRPCPRHCGEITQGSYWGFGQEEVPGSLRSHCWPVLFPHQEEDQSPTRGRSLLLCQQRHPPHLRHHGVAVSGTPRRRLLPLHRLLRRSRRSRRCTERSLLRGVPDTAT